MKTNEQSYPLEVDKAWGVGRRRYKHILAEGYKTIGDMAERGSEKTFIRLFGANFGKMIFQIITGKEQGRVMPELSENYKPKQGPGYGHTFSEGSTDADRIKGEFAIVIQRVCYRMRGYGIRANSFSGEFGYNKQGAGGVGFRFVTDGYTNIDYIYKACMDKIKPAIEKACENGIEIRNIAIYPDQIDKSSQMDVFFQEDEEPKNQIKAMDEIKNRFGQEYISKGNTLLRVEGNTHFLERNV